LGTEETVLVDTSYSQRGKICANCANCANCWQIIFAAIQGVKELIRYNHRAANPEFSTLSLAATSRVENSAQV
jgi:hypothetical protein